MIVDLKSYYSNRFRKFSRSPAAVQYSSRDSQISRFKVLCKDIPDSASVVDVGCGLGDMLHYLRGKGYQGKYMGVDFTPEFIAAAKEDFSQDSNCQFLELDLLKENIPVGYEYSVLSGVFNNRLNGNYNVDFLYSTIEKMYKSASKGVRFNALSSFVDYFEDDLFYINPLEIFEHCRENLTPYVTLKHDYILSENGFPFEFVITLSKFPDNVWE